VSGAITFPKRVSRRLSVDVVARKVGQVICVILKKFTFISCVFKRGVFFSLFSLI